MILASPIRHWQLIETLTNHCDVRTHQARFSTRFYSRACTVRSNLHRKVKSKRPLIYVFIVQTKTS